MIKDKKYEHPNVEKFFSNLYTASVTNKGYKMEQNNNSSKAMETETIQKTGQDLQSRKSGEILQFLILSNMKKLSLMFLAAVLTASFTFAQIKIGGKEGNVGLRAGLNLAKIVGDEVDAYDDSGYDIKYKPGIQLGLVVEFPTKNEKIVIQPGILFSQTGSKYEMSESEKVYDSTIMVEEVVTGTMNYFQVPVNFIYKHDLGSCTLLLQAGPYLGYAIGGKYKYEESYTINPDPNKVSGKESESGSLKFGSSKKNNYKSFDLGFGLGAGLMFSDKFQVGIGYNIGLADIGHGISAKNRFISFTLTYILGK